MDPQARDAEREADRSEQQRPAWHGLWLWAALVAAAVFFPKWRGLLLGIALLVIVLVVYLAPAVAWGLARGVRVTAVGFFFGRWIARFTLAGLPIRVNVIPTGGYVKFAGTDDADLGAAANRDGVPFEQTHTAQPRWQRIAMTLAMPLASLLLAAAMLGPTAAIESFLRGLEQFTVGAFRPTADRVAAIGRLFERLQSGELALALGVIAAKNAAVNLVPFPAITNGGAALMELIGAIVAIRPKRLAAVYLASFLAMWTVILLWGYALLIFLFSK